MCRRPSHVGEENILAHLTFPPHDAEENLFASYLSSPIAGEAKGDVSCVKVSRIRSKTVLGQSRGNTARDDTARDIR